MHIWRTFPRIVRRLGRSTSLYFFLGLHEHFFIIFLNKTELNYHFFLVLKCYTVRILSFFKAKLVYINDIPSRVTAPRDCSLTTASCTEQRFHQMRLPPSSRTLNTSRNGSLHERCISTPTNVRWPILPGREWNRNAVLHQWQGAEYLQSAKYLGINICDNLFWNTHISPIRRKAKNTTAFIRLNLS